MTVPDHRAWFGIDPFCEQGAIRATRSERGSLIVVCDECGRAWPHPDQIGMKAYHQGGPDNVFPWGDRIVPRSGYVTRDEVEAYGWAEFLVD